MICRRLLPVLCALMLGMLGSGCGMALSGGRIQFDDLKYPASMSGSLYGPNGDVVREGDGLIIVKEFEYTKNYWSTLYSIIPLSHTGDIVDQMNKEIEQSGGDGIIDVAVSSDYSILTSLFPLNILPIWPGCSKIRVTGDIVKLYANPQSGPFARRDKNSPEFLVQSSE